MPTVQRDLGILQAFILYSLLTVYQAEICPGITQLKIWNVTAALLLLTCVNWKWDGTWNSRIVAVSKGKQSKDMWESGAVVGLNAFNKLI